MEAPSGGMLPAPSLGWEGDALERSDSAFLDVAGARVPGRAASLAAAAARIALWPLTLSLWALSLAGRVTLAEPAADAAGEALLPFGEDADEADARAPPPRRDWPIVLSRYTHAAGGVSPTVWAQINAWNLVLEALHVFGLADVVAAWRTEAAAAARALLRPAAARAAPLAPRALANLAAPTWALPFDPAADFPFSSDGHQVEAAEDAAFLARVCAATYEEPAAAAEVARAAWGLDVDLALEVPAHHVRRNGRRYIPDVACLLASGQRFTVLAFRGADPLVQLHRCAEVPASLVAVAGYGRVNRGLLRGLTQRRRVAGGARGRSLAAELAAALAAAPGGAERRLYIAGHSLGGCAAELFARFLAVSAPHLATRVAGIATFGACAVGDADFARGLEASYPNRCWRYVLRADAIARLPPSDAAHPYEAAGALRLLATPWVQRACGRGALVAAAPRRGRGVVLLAEEDFGREKVEAAAAAEDAYGAAAGAARLATELAARPTAATAMHAALAALPGMADHQVAEYAAALDALLAG